MDAAKHLIPIEQLAVVGINVDSEEALKEMIEQVPPQFRFRVTALGDHPHLLAFGRHFPELAPLSQEEAQLTLGLNDGRI